MKVSAQKLTMYTGIGLIVFIVGIIAFMQFNQAQSMRVASEFSYEGQPSLGNTEAPIKVALFEDFRCGGCAMFTETVFPQLENDFINNGDVEVFFYNFPILGDGSFQAANVAECVYQENAEAFWDYKKIAFSMHMREGPQSMNPGRLSGAATAAIPGLDGSAINQCATEGWYADAVQNDLSIANELGLNSTPSIMVNGRRVPSTSYAAVRDAINSELRRTN
ncbi:MAG: thioredoxin domain-containing protein [Deinococcota bacterium]